jgi:uncharacterized protein
MSSSVKILPCAGGCRSCYEAELRRCTDRPLDVAAVVAAIRTESAKTKDDKHRRPPCVHGGEPLIIAPPKLEAILSAVFDEYGRTSLQTGGVGLCYEHLAIFARYKTAVGLSLDGDTGEMNRGRWNAEGITPETAERMTEATLVALRQLRDAGLPVGVITLLRKYNAGVNRVGDLLRFLLRLRDEFGVCDVRCNEVICFDPAQAAVEELSAGELGAAFAALAEVCFSDRYLSWQPFREIVDLLWGHRSANCSLMECDPWRTEGEVCILGDGSIGSCLKTGAGRDGIQALAAESRSSLRSELLRGLPMEEDGCGRCRWWLVCRGGCPGAGEGGDYRARTRFCSAYRRLFEFIEDRLRGLLPNIVLATTADAECAAVTAASLESSTWRSSLRRPLEELIRLADKGRARQIVIDNPHHDHTDAPK